MFRYGKFIALVLVLLVAIGCSKPPDTEMQAANNALASAKAAEAEQYAPKAFRTAMDTLNAANAAKQEQDSKFALFRSYGKAKALFASAEKLANESVTAGAAEKARVQAEVATMLTDTKAQIDAAGEALAKAPVGKGNKADIELIKNDLASTTTAYDDAQNDFNNGKFLVAKSKLTAVSQRAASIIAQIEQAKEMAKGKRK